MGQIPLLIGVNEVNGVIILAVTNKADQKIAGYSAVFSAEFLAVAPKVVASALGPQ